MLLMLLVGISFIVAVTAALVVLWKGKNSTLNRWLAIFLVVTASWGVIVNLQSPSQSELYNLWVVRFTFVAAIVMSYAMVRFVLAVSKTKLTGLIRPFLTIATVILGVIMLTPAVIPSVTVLENTVVPYRTSAYYAIAGYILILSVFAIIMMYLAIRRTRLQFARRQLVVVFYGLTVGIILAATTNIVLPNILHSIYPARYAWVAILVWTLSLIYTVIKHKFLDIRFAAVRTAAYVLSLVMLVVVYYGLALLISNVIFQNERSIQPVSVVIALILAFLFQPVKKFFDRLTSRLFYRDNYVEHEFLVELTRVLTLTTNIRTLIANASDYIAQTLKSEQVSMFVRYHHGRFVTGGTDKHKKVPINDIEQLDAFFDETGDYTIISELSEDKSIRRMLLSHQIAIVLPIIRSNNRIGYVFIGDKRTSGYSQRDMRVLSSVPNELVIAIENAISIQEIKELNDTLQQRIDNATKDLTASNRQLLRLDQAKDEFVSMASHQLRTPLTSVKGYIDMVLEGDAGKITDQQKHLLREAFSSSERMVHLINDFLSVSRLQTGKFMIDKRPIDLAKVTAQEVDGLRTTAAGHQLKLVYRQPKNIPVVQADENKIRQVMMNFMDNAIYYSPEGKTIDISVIKEANRVIFTVEDHGMGVPKSEQSSLFGKFFRASNARKQRPDGTGVGLFLAKKVITSHRGGIIFESAEGKGSTFGFWLPVAEPELVGENRDDTDDNQHDN